MAIRAEGNQVFFCIITEATARLNMVHLQISAATTLLTAPLIAPQNR
jgi:hypothetical protein